MPAFPSSLTTLSFGREATRGVAVAVTDSIPISSAPKVKRAITPLPDASLRGSAVEIYSQAQGKVITDISFDGDVFVDSIGVPLRGIYGQELLAGAAAPYSHTFSVLNSGDQQPASWSMVDNYSVNARSYPGCQFGELGFKWSADGKLNYSAKTMGLAEVPIAAPVASYSTLQPVAAWAATLQIGGVAAYPSDATWTIKRKLTPIHVQDGTQGPRQIFVGPVAIDFKITLLMEADTYYTQYINNTQPSIVFNFTTGSGAGQQGITLQTNQAAWDSNEIDRGKDWVQLMCNGKGIGNAADSGASGGVGPGRVVLTNARSTVY